MIVDMVTAETSIDDAHALYISDTVTSTALLKTVRISHTSHALVLSATNNCIARSQRAKVNAHLERIPNGHSFNILHMHEIAGELKRAGDVLHTVRWTR